MVAALWEIAAQFRFAGEVAAAEAIDAGHINDSFRVVTSEHSYFLQRINHHIFTDVAALMENIQRVTEHLAGKTASGQPLRLIAARDGRPFYAHADGTYWRAFPFIEGAHAGHAVKSPKQAYQAAFAFGRFQRMLADLPGERLHETIPNFHNTPLRFAAFEDALAADVAGRAAATREEIAFALERKAMAGALLAAGLPERVTHNDTKFNNVLLDDRSGEAICVVDLDTVMPGLAPYDFGDLVRTAATTAAEDEADLTRVAIDLRLFEALARGYIAATRGFLTRQERDTLTLTGKLITFEQGVRFLADYLAGDTYYKIHSPGQNLQRCRAQFQLVRSIEEHEERLLEIVGEADSLVE